MVTIGMMRLGSRNVWKGECMPTQTFFNLPDAKRQAIVEVALREFAANDPVSASVSRIVEQAGIAKGAMYRYITGKEDLYLYLLDLANRARLHFMQAENPPSGRAGFFDLVRLMLEADARFREAHPLLEQVLHRAVYSDHPLREEAVRRLREPLYGFWRELIDRDVAQGTLDPSFDPNLILFAFATLSTALPDYVRSTVSPDADPTELASHAASELVRMLECGLARRQA